MPPPVRLDLMTRKGVNNIVFEIIVSSLMKDIVRNRMMLRCVDTSTGLTVKERGRILMIWNEIPRS